MCDLSHGEIMENLATGPPPATFTLLITITKENRLSVHPFFLSTNIHEYKTTLVCIGEGMLNTFQIKHEQPIRDLHTICSLLPYKVKNEYLLPKTASYFSLMGLTVIL